jgi:hypothetical protein
VAVVAGDDVNLRVGPRVDDREVARLARDTVLVVVERAGEWLGVRVPSGFPAAVAAALVDFVGDDDVKVLGERVNLRVRPPKGDLAYPAFRDRPAKGAVLPVISREGEWVWVEAPEEVRAYVHSKFVRELGPLAAERDRVAAAREARAARRDAYAKARREAKAAADEAAVRDETAAVGLALVRLRSAGGSDKAPVVALSDRLESALDAHPRAEDRTKALAKAVLEDLEREIELRVAHHDDVVARLRTGSPPPAAPPAPAPKQDGVVVEGVVRWEAAPGWEGGGAYVLWAADRPTHALRWSGGDLRAHDDGRARRVTGKTLGGRLLGLPTLEVSSVSLLGR